MAIDVIIHPACRYRDEHGVIGAPAALPLPLVTKLNAEFNRITEQPEMRKKMQELELEPMPLNSGELADFIRSEYPFWQQFLSTSGIRLDP